MYAIKMNDDKSLVTTVHATIYQNEKNADMIVFLLPKYYGEKNISDCSVLLRYILPDSTGRSEELEMEPEPYNERYYRYHLSINSSLTEAAGAIELWINILDEHEDLVLTSGTTEIEIVPAKDITDYLSSKDLNQLDRMQIQLKDLNNKKADGLAYDQKTHRLQLTSGNVVIGNEVVVPSDSCEE